VGEAWSSFAVSGAAAVTQEQRGDQEMVVRYDVETGGQVWTHADQAALLTTVGGRGPRATPTIVDGQVYALGATGILNCLELETGRPVWSHNVVEERGVNVADYGLPSSPLVVDDLVIVQIARVERSLVAYHRFDGELVWRADSGKGSYSSPVLATVAGIRQILIVNRSSVAGHAVEDGRLLWQEDWQIGGDKITPPLLMGPDRLLVSAGYGAGSRLFHLRAEGDGLRVEQIWKSPRLKSKFASMVLHRGTVYGLDDGVLTALDPETGERLWKKGRYGHGQLILVGDLLLIQTEGGAVVLVEASPDAHRELARLEALGGKTWNPPALAGRLLLVRNNREAVCYELPTE
jgi:outer membrane protein assembly factor BamB